MGLTQELIGRRGFMLGAGGFAAGLVASAACARDEFQTQPYVLPTASAQDGGHGARPPADDDRPQPGGNLEAVRSAVLEPLDPNPTKTLIIEARDELVEVAGGVKLHAWTYDGVVPGKVVHVRQGDTINFTFRNAGADGALDRLPRGADAVEPQLRHDQCPDEELSFQLEGELPGRLHVPLRHRTGDRAHRQRHVRRRHRRSGGAAARRREEYVLVQSEFYLKKDEEDGDWEGDAERMSAVLPDFVIFNGAANQYQQEPLPANVGELIRLHVMNAGPTLFSAFHVIGAIFEQVYHDGNPANVMHGHPDVDHPARRRRDVRADNPGGGPVPVRDTQLRVHRARCRGTARRDLGVNAFGCQAAGAASMARALPPRFARPSAASASVTADSIVSALSG